MAKERVRQTIAVEVGVPVGVETAEGATPESVRSGIPKAMSKGCLNEIVVMRFPPQRRASSRSLDISCDKLRIYAEERAAMMRML